MRAPVPWTWVAVFAAAKLAGTMAFADRYGWHGDELYFLASSRHLAFGYVDFPPLVPLLAAADQAVAPGSLVAFRLLPALAGAVIVVLTALIAHELGATSRAQAWAAFGLLLSPVYIAGNFLFHTVTFDQLAWAAALLVFARLLRIGAPRLWLFLGLVIGVGLETKFTIAALPVAIFLGLLAANRRSMLISPWPWIGLAIALVLFIPNLAWQATHDWISVQYTLSHRGHTDGPVAYWLQQFILGFNPVFLVAGIAGMVTLHRDERFRPLVYTVIAVELFFFAVGGKSYYPAAVFPAFIAAGAIWLDQRLTRKLWVRAFAIVSTALMLVLLPALLPLYPVQTMISMKLYQTNNNYAHMIGWPELAKQIAQVYDSIPSDQRANAIILAHYYGEAGAIDYYGPALGLPQVVSPHLTYWYWAPPRMNPNTVVLINYTLDEGNQLFTDCRQVGTVNNSFGIATEEYGAPILVCSNPRRPLWQVWPSLQTLD